MSIYGLTGGVGSGKSTVAALFSNLGIDVIDTDQISRALVAPNTEVLAKIIEYFGKSYLLSSGELDRSALRERIFSDADGKKWLENLLHPLIREHAISEALGSKSPYCLIVIPLLLENNAVYPIDGVIVVDCTEAQQKQRVMTRDQLAENIVSSMIEQQVSRKTRLQHADYVIENTGDAEALSKQVTQLHEQLMLHCSNP